MPINTEMLHGQSPDNVSALKAIIAQLEDDNALLRRNNAELRENQKKTTERDTENWNRLCVKYNKLIELKKEFCEKFKDIELEIYK